MKESDLTIIEEARNGSQRAYTKLYNKYNKSIYGTIYNITRNTDVSDDILSETFTRAFKNLDRFTKDISFEMWLKTIANNRSIDFIRSGMKTKNDVYVDDDQLSEFIYTDWNNPEKDYIQKESEQILENAIFHLKGRSKEVLTLRFYNNLTYQEIADKLGLKIGTVKHYISRYKQKITENIKNNQQKVKTNEKKSILVNGNEITS
jgi:RNA polymerase sigma-70 factor (ECF subfamily)